MGYALGWLVVATLGLVASQFAGAAVQAAVHWEYYVVSTPDFYGAFRGDSPGFRAPIPKKVSQPKLRLKRATRVSGTLEAIVNTDGRTRFERSLAVSGPGAERRIKAVINGWHFTPATLDGQPIRVRIRVTVYDE